MRIGILTFHSAINYGAVLQTYATQEIVKEYGHDVEVIDYHNNTVDFTYNQMEFHFGNLPKKRFYKIPSYILEKYFFLKRRKAYNHFINHYINLTDSQYKQGEKICINGYDIILIGSDQLWNHKLTGGFDDVYWGEFDTDHKTRKIAWSICMNNYEVTSEERDYVVKHLDNFSFISVREKSLRTFLKELTNKEYPLTVDPTLLLSKQQWEKLCHPVKEKNFIVVYALLDEDKAVGFARQVARNEGKKLLVIRSFSHCGLTSENIEYAGPADFLSYIRYADYVITTSFHGTVFSLIYGKPFYVINGMEDGRIRDILKLFGAEKNNFPFGIQDVEPI